ncbi:ABC transporter permease [Clostridium tarantellae]|uniref:ABC transporter permease subunit n=1 Tax=Clostridium tarantellae TaxID=39493 RepID=A0A6I1ML62_9CLOT|nr:ABC transporter permease [Clostridium tarantellae]MPQ43714.1 ABC transporter permease subunit [Clostridium tarantellae]
MIKYIIRRILQMIPILLGVSIIIFVVISLAPGDAVDNKANPNMTEEKKQELREQMGLDKPLPVRYVNWLKDSLTGNFGESTKFKQPVVDVINTYIWNSFFLALTAFIASIFIAVPIGIVSATKQYSFIDGFFTVLALIGISLPAFFLGLLLIKFLAFDFKIFPVGGMTSTGSTATGFKHIIDVLYHMFLPFLVLTLVQVGALMRYTRTSVLEVIRQDYIRTARAKGLKESIVIYKHAFRNALIPIVTILALSLPSLFGGAMITERIFAWPGIGRVAFDCLNARDYQFLMAFNMFMAMLALVGNLIADISYAVVDPRIRLK